MKKQLFFATLICCLFVKTNALGNENVYNSLTKAETTSLPFLFNSGHDAISSTDGMIQYGLGADVSSPTQLNFDSDGDYVRIHYDSTAIEMIYYIKGSPFEGTFEVQESVDGTNYTTIRSYNSLSNGLITEQLSLNSASRYILFKCSKKSSGNVALGNIAIIGSKSVLPSKNIEAIEISNEFRIRKRNDTWLKYIGNSYTITFNKGTNETSAPSYSDKKIKLYAGNIVTIAAVDPIYKIEIQYWCANKVNGVYTEMKVDASPLVNGKTMTVNNTTTCMGSWAILPICDTVKYIVNQDCEITNIKVYYRYVRTDQVTGKYNTICVPYNVAAADRIGATFYGIGEVNTSTANNITKLESIYLTNEITGDLVAGTPYIYKSTGDKLVLKFSGSPIDNPLVANGLVGTFEPIKIPVGSYVLENANIFYDHTKDVGLYNVTYNYWIPENSAYIDISQSIETINKGSDRIQYNNGTKQVTTSDSNVITTESTHNTIQGIYDITGRKYNEIPCAGVYIVNGTKVVVK